MQEKNYLLQCGEVYIASITTDDWDKAQEYFEEVSKEFAGEREYELLSYTNDFELVIEKTPEEALLDGDNLSSDDMEELISEYEIYEEELEETRWHMVTNTVIEVKDQKFLIKWNRGLTEDIEDEYPNQPVPCILIEQEVLETKTIIKIRKEDIDE